MGVSSIILFSSVLSQIFLTYSTTKVEIYWNLWIWLPNFTNSPVRSYNVFLFYYSFIYFYKWHFILCIHLFYAYGYFVYVYICTPKKASDSYELPCGGWELTLGHLEEHSPLQTFECFLNKWVFNLTANR